MELRHLKFFVEVVRRGGFSAAAKTLSSTQSTVSKAVQQLEHDCGTLLLSRLPQVVRPTDAGELVARRAAAMLAERERLEAELAARRGLETGRLRFGVTPMGSSVIFAPLIAEYRRRHPGIQMLLREEGSHTLEEAVQSGEIEVGTSLLPVGEGLAWRAICDEPMVALLPPGHALAGRERIRFRELADSPCIYFELGFALNSLIADACRREGIELPEAARSGQPEFIASLAGAGLGIALFPRLMIPALPKHNAKTALIEGKFFRWKLAAIWRRNSPLSPPARQWLNLIATSRAGRFSAGEKNREAVPRKSVTPHFTNRG